jgi:hypothetical protein
MHAFPDTSDRSKAPMPADRAAQQPWLVAGALLFAPFASRDGGPSAGEADAIQAMGKRLERDRRAGLLPNSTRPVSSTGLAWRRSHDTGTP